ncbi:hypothetical protein ACF09J_35365 [Streptomyces sp. NPDC014889]|uniref:hypothetical protein n=1 Tax=Streptomyces sp. NPDC014889 TaxID=3364928 RepID=UPI0036FBF4CF
MPLLGAVLVLFGSAGLAVVAESLDTVRAFRAARSCPDGKGPGPRPGEDCLRVLPATVKGTVIVEAGKYYKEYTLKLSGPRQVPAELDMGDADPLLRHLNRGDQVTVSVWRGYAPSVSKDGVTQATADTPESEPNISMALSLALFTVGLYGLYAGAVTLRHAQRELPKSLTVRGKEALTAAIAAVPARAIGDMIGGPVAVTLVWVAMLPVIWWIGRLAWEKN